MITLLLILWGIIGFLHHWKIIQTSKKYFYEKYLEKSRFDIIDFGYLLAGILNGLIVFFIPRPYFLTKEIKLIWYFKYPKQTNYEK